MDAAPDSHPGASGQVVPKARKTPIFFPVWAAKRWNGFTHVGGGVPHPQRRLRAAWAMRIGGSLKGCGLLSFPSLDDPVTLSPGQTEPRGEGTGKRRGRSGQGRAGARGTGGAAARGCLSPSGAPGGCSSAAGRAGARRAAAAAGEARGYPRPGRAGPGQPRLRPRPRALGGAAPGRTPRPRPGTRVAPTPATCWGCAGAGLGWSRAVPGTPGPAALGDLRAGGAARHWRGRKAAAGGTEPASGTASAPPSESAARPEPGLERG